MPAKGQSGRIYSDREILDDIVYPSMKAETLWSIGPTPEQVFPVRHATSPHFRRFRASAFVHRIDAPRPRSEAHTKCIAFLLRKVQEGGIKVTTPTFEFGVRAPDGQVVLEVRKEHYRWWSDKGGTRIAVGYGRYIQPDLCGRIAQADSFAASMRWPNLIVEVIDTHYPEEGTFYELLRLSTKNHIVVLHFIRAPSFSSYWSQLLTPERARPILRAVHLLIDGNVVINGQPLEDSNAPPQDRSMFSLWYADFCEATLKPALVAKNNPPNRVHPARDRPDDAEQNLGPSATSNESKTAPSGPPQGRASTG